MADLRAGILETAKAIGANPLDLATVISYETGGTFDPLQLGPTTQWGQHRGLIQFGEPQARQYGVNWDDPLGSQLGPDGAIARYFRDRGYQPGMGLLDLYSTVNAGRPGLYNRTDANNGGAPGTVRDKVENQMEGHRRRAAALLGGDYAQGPQIAADAMRALGIEGPTMAQNEPTGGLLGRVSTQNQGGSIWDRIGGGFLSDPDRRARIAMALEGMTTNQNLAYISALQGDMQQRREEAKTAEQRAQQEQQKNATIAWLRSQGREDLANAMAAGLSANAAFSMALERADPTAGVVVEGRLVNPVTGQVIYEPTGDNAADPEDVRKLRTEFSGLSRVKDFSQQAAAYGRVVASANDPSAAGDLALIFNYMKVLDPGSTVREGEFATAENSGGVDDRVRSIYNKLLNGERLTPAQRNDFGDRATRLYQNAEKDYQGIFDQFADIAKRRGLPIEDALIDFRYSGEAFQPQAVAPFQGPAAPPPPPPAGVTPEDWQRAWQNMTEYERTLFMQGTQ